MFKWLKKTIAEHKQLKADISDLAQTLKNYKGEKLRVVKRGEHNITTTYCFQSLEVDENHDVIKLSNATDATVCYLHKYLITKVHLLIVEEAFLYIIIMVNEGWFKSSIEIKHSAKTM